MKIKRQREFCCGLLFVAAGLAFAWGAGTWPLGHRATPGPGLFGLGLALALTLLGGAVLFRATALETPGGDPLDAAGLRSAAWVLLALVAVGALLPRLGLPCTVAVATLLARAAFPAAAGSGPSTVRWRAWRRALAHALASGAVAWGIGQGVLALPWPMWPRPFALGWA